MPVREYIESTATYECEDRTEGCGSCKEISVKFVESGSEISEREWHVNYRKWAACVNASVCVDLIYWTMHEMKCEMHFIVH